MLLDTGQYLNRNALKIALAVLAFAVVGMLVGGAGYAYADSPQFCGSCHSMTESAASWQASNHKQFSCTDCHLPHQNLAIKLIVKGKTGMNDTYHEVLRDYPATMVISPEGKAIVNDNCLRCHQSSVENTAMAAGGQDCLKCHRGLVHGMSKSKGGIKVE
ncbi:cytochrome c3 family protein [Sporomusa sp.]|uniref:cytochrome c3 family protein n=1 Tax=Sporomusa sp. TaxID=2078658 RepID=UPI003BEEF89E